MQIQSYQFIKKIFYYGKNNLLNNYFGILIHEKKKSAIYLKQYVTLNKRSNLFSILFYIFYLLKAQSSASNYISIKVPNDEQKQ